MSWYKLYTHSTPDERREMLLLMLRQVEARHVNPDLLLRFVEYLETPSRARFVFPLLAAQGLSLAIGLGLGSAFGLILILVVNVALVGVVALHSIARLEPDPAYDQG